MNTQEHKHLGHCLAQFGGGHTQKQTLDARRVGEGSQDVKDRTNTNLTPHRGSVAHCRVEGRGKHESNPRFQNAPFNSLGGKLDFDPQCFQNVRRAAGAGCCPVAVLGHLQTGARGYESRGGGNVEGILAVAAGTHAVHQGPVHVNGECFLSHDRCHTGDFLNALALQSQSG